MKRPNSKLEVILRVAVAIATAVAASVSASESNAESAKSKLDPIEQIYRVKEDLEFDGFTVGRIYSSQSVFRGRFGLGWCSDVDGEIEFFADGIKRYRGCNPHTAAMIDPRADRRPLRATRFGFERTREDGAKQIFAKSGKLVSIQFNDSSIVQIERDENGQIFALKVGSHRHTIATDKRGLITRVGAIELSYVDDVVVALNETGRSRWSRYSYDLDKNMVDWKTENWRERVTFDSDQDRVVAVLRETEGRKERILLNRPTPTGGKTMIEMKMMIERGAEMHPARILYDEQSRDLEFEGSEITARVMFDWFET